MNKETKDTLKKVADYADTEKKMLAKRMCDMTVAALIMYIAFIVLRYTGLADSARPYQNLSEFALGLTGAALVLNIMYCTGLLDKIRAAKISFLNKKINKDAE